MDDAGSGTTVRARQRNVPHLRRYGLLLLLLATILPYHGCRAHPSHYDLSRSREEGYYLERPGVIPTQFMKWVIRDKVLGLPAGDTDFSGQPKSLRTDDYAGHSIFFAVPLWILALALARIGGKARIAAAVLAWAGMIGSLAAIGIPVVGGDFLHLFPEPFREVESAAMLLAAFLLAAARPRHRWDFADVEATVSSNALLGIGAALYWPMHCYLRWTLKEGHSWGPVMASLWENYRIGFWVGLAGLLLVAAPLYFSGARGAALYDSPFPWHSPSSTPTPTSTSTGSTPIGTPSSTGPGPRDSSPS